MARRPDERDREMLNEENLKELRHNLAHLSLPAVQNFYDVAYRDCGLIYSNLPSPCQVQTHVQVVEALVEMAVFFLRRLIQMPRLTTPKHGA